MEPNGVSHLDGCPMGDVEVDEDAVCICEELGQDVKTLMDKEAGL